MLLEKETLDLTVSNTAPFRAPAISMMCMHVWEGHWCQSEDGTYWAGLDSASPPIPSKLK